MGARTASRRQPCVYVMRREDGAVKIGFTVNLTLRHYQVSRDCSQAVEVYDSLAAERVHAAARIERRSHEILASERLDGEWFNVPPQMALGAVLAGSTEIPFDSRPIPMAGPFSVLMWDGKLIRAARRLLGWSAEELAERVGLSRASITNIEGGKTDPRLSTLQAIHETFQTAGVRLIRPGEAGSGGKGVRFG